MRLLGELPTCPERCEDDDKGGWGRPAPRGGQQCRAKGPRRARPGHDGNEHRRRGDEEAGGLVATWPRVGAGRGHERGDEDLELEHEDLEVRRTNSSRRMQRKADQSVLTAGAPWRASGHSMRIEKC